MTYRERRLRKAERLRGWAEKRDEAAAAERQLIAETDATASVLLVGLLPS